MSPAAWIAGSELPWQRLVAFGPSGFEAYARLRFLPDPVYAGQSEADVDEDAPPEHDLLRTALDVLTQHTGTSDECYFCLWDGWGLTVEPDGPKVVVPGRAYFLFRGSLSSFGDWGAADLSPGLPRSYMPDPAFIWPADHAWCVAKDVDPHYAGIGAAAAAIDDLLAEPSLDVVPADSHQEPPHYD
ncbi:MAG: hypothetical protein ACRDP2_00400 [Nocardioidaceae bacterium]